ncbi:hypothetical protein [Acetobacter pomorum]|nr:hypothetical protein [Acetobacter pomorum]
MNENRENSPAKTALILTAGMMAFTIFGIGIFVMSGGSTEHMAGWGGFIVIAVLYYVVFYLIARYK